ncbi:MAG: peptidoglycan DD-metalloendopeptidase family protein [Alphaproteobacteria bacterium]|nr:peptidoglycan DD-metalloendopeptidase family protein [Alphaproteobacteria bacterium]
MSWPVCHRGKSIRQRLRTAPWLVICAFALAACDAFSGPAPVADRSYGARQAPASQPGVHVVKRGETVYGIAQRNNISTRALIDRNSLRPPYLLAAGTRLQLPTAQAHIVRRGDTLYAISRRYGVDTASLARANRLRSPYTIHVGQRLLLPFGTGLAAPSQVARAQPAPPTASARAPSSSATRSPSPSTSTSVSGVPRPKPVFRPAPPMPKRDAGGFIWPVEGRVLSSFGAKASALHNDGLNIAAPMGAPVRAADNGVVAYAGNQIRGFGNMLLIKHSDGLITAYAHADKLLVTRGDVVSRGQVIARVGKTGGIEAPQLHFEVRKGSQAVDPRKFLPS